MHWYSHKQLHTHAVYTGTGIGGETYEIDRKSSMRHMHTHTYTLYMCMHTPERMQGGYVHTHTHTLLTLHNVHAHTKTHAAFTGFFCIAILLPIAGLC